MIAWRDLNLWRPRTMSTYLFAWCNLTSLNNVRQNQDRNNIESIGSVHLYTVLWNVRGFIYLFLPWTPQFFASLCWYWTSRLCAKRYFLAVKMAMWCSSFTYYDYRWNSTGSMARIIVDGEVSNSRHQRGVLNKQKQSIKHQKVCKLRVNRIQLCWDIPFELQM